MWFAAEGTENFYVANETYRKLSIKNTLRLEAPPLLKAPPPIFGVATPTKVANNSSK